MWVKHRISTRENERMALQAKKQMQKKFSRNHPREMAPESEQPCEFGMVHNQGFEQEFHNDVDKPEQRFNLK